MNLQDQVIYRCIHAACARPLPRRVNFCPYCGTGQHDGVVKPAHAIPPAPAAIVQAAAPVLAPVVVATSPPEVQPAPPVIAKAAPPAAPSRPQAAAAPPRREPVRMRYWLIALATLWLIWLYARPSSSKIEARIESAMTASAECRFNDAQSELIALRMTRATPEQLSRLQVAINAAVPACEKKKLRAKAWSDTALAVESALAAGDFPKAQARLLQFTRRHGDDDDTRKLRDKIAEQRFAAPAETVRVPPSAAETAQSVRNLINEAERALAVGNYKSASDKLETCITMVDRDNRECAAFKVYADRMQEEFQRCQVAGRPWSEDRCQ
ncbi:MAG: hypothetical protein V4631_02510 [Pseudomonadota bacterium]